MARPCAFLLTVPLLASAAVCQTTFPSPEVATVPAGTPLPLLLTSHTRMKTGQPVHAELLYPLYVDNHLLLPARTVVEGSVISLRPDQARRKTSRLRADFTPFHTPVVRFKSLVAPDGRIVPIATADATNGAPLYRIIPTPKVQGSLFHRYVELGKQMAREKIAIVTGPEKRDRLQQFLYTQLPYHPERIARETAFTAETEQPVTLSPLPLPSVQSAVPNMGQVGLQSAKPVTDGKASDSGSSPMWRIEAYLNQPISSENSNTDQIISATVAEPIMNADGTIAVPQGSVLSGSVVEARPSRRFARQGVLRFSFRQLTRPGEETQAVRASLASIDGSSEQLLALDSEGNAKPKPQDKIIVPALLLLAASSPLHHDEGRTGNSVRKDAVASGSLGLLGFIIGTAAQQQNVAAGLGYYSAALSIYPRFIAKGKAVSFPKDTRVILETTAPRRQVLRATSIPTQ